MCYRGMAQVVEHLPGMWKILNSNPSVLSQKKKKKNFAYYTYWGGDKYMFL
jgi:hypothetical protein